MVTREDANTLRKALGVPCSRMYSSEFYLGIYINILRRYTLSGPFLMKILSCLRRNGKDKYIGKLTQTEVNRGEFIGKMYLLEYGVNIKAM